MDTEAYFTKYELQKSSIKLDLICNNSKNLQIAIGYKSPSEALMTARTNLKEIVIWSGADNFQEFSIDYNIRVEKSESQITKEWDLFGLGFNADEYLKADERIWYLRINDNSGGPYGYEKNVTIEVNGTTYSAPEYFPNIHYIEQFKLIFETMLYPFFDGSKEIIIPIRGVNHELAIEDLKTEAEIKGMTPNTYSTTIPGTGSNSMWTIVFGTSDYLPQSQMYDLFYPPMECRGFIQGIEKAGAPSEFSSGILDYGWRVAYCMDGSTQQTDMATCTQTDDGYLEKMFDYVNGKLGLTGKLIVFVACHGKSYYGYHLTFTGETKYWFFGWTNVIRLRDYEEKIDAITTDGTHVLLWISACHGNGLDSFSSSDHNTRLESWSFKPLHWGSPSNGWVDNEETDTYEDFCWLYYQPSGANLNGRSEAAYFFIGAAEGACQKSVTYLGENKIKPYYDSQYNNADCDYSQMYIQSTWGSYSFYVNWGY